MELWNQECASFSVAWSFSIYTDILERHWKSMWSHILKVEEKHWIYYWRTRKKNIVQLDLLQQRSRFFVRLFFFCFSPLEMLVLQCISLSMSLYIKLCVISYILFIHWPPAIISSTSLFRSDFRVVRYSP